MSARNMEFVGRVLDNVHGFMYVAWVGWKDSHKI